VYDNELIDDLEENGHVIVEIIPKYLPGMTEELYEELQS
jgi:hypothetical protein